MRDEGGIFMDVDVEMVHSFGWLFAKLPENLQFFAGLNFPKPGRYVHACAQARAHTSAQAPACMAGVA